MRCNTRSARRPIMYTRRPIGGFLSEIMNAPINELVKEPRTVKSKPAVNVIENKDAFILTMAIPGFTKDQIDIKVKDGFLTIENKETTTENTKYKFKEFDYKSFKRSFKLGDTIDLRNIKAQMEQGILSITLNKKEEQKARTINIY